MKKWIVRIILAIVVIGAFAGVGLAGYRLGLNQGAQFSGKFDVGPQAMERFHKDGMSEFQFGFHHNDRGFHSGFGGPGGFHGRGFGFMSPLFVLLKVAVLGLLAWVGYTLFTRNGWQLSLTRHPAETPPAQPSDTPDAKKPKGKQ